jgi:16S rRNA C967 or C1407 C5-methylase (RsmB/RsmF family)/NOL1/NOP2/fmu family ribosome biogenesis protein
MNLPEAFITNIKSRLGADYEAFTESLKSESPTSIRLNPLKKSSPSQQEKGLGATVATDEVSWHPEAYYLAERPVFTLDPAFHAGAYYVQEASSMFVAEAVKQTVDLSKPLKVLDLCAAPGGKTTLLASLLNENSILVANEVIKGRIGVLKENLEKWGFANYIVSNHDPEEMVNLEEYFDVVLVDAPCSGEGLFRKDPAAINEWSENNVNICSARQKRILQAASMLVAPKGILLYSTCTYNEKENQQNAKWITQVADFEQVKLNVPSEWNIDETDGGYQFFPHKVQGEGFFLSVFQKKASIPFQNQHPKVKLNKVSNRQIDFVKKYIKNPDDFDYFVKNEGTVIAINKNVIKEFGFVLWALDKRSSGFEIGLMKGNDFVPSHSLALSTILNNELPAIELPKEEALKYLKREPFEAENAPNGWVLVRYEGLNLGWIKVIGDRINNYLPKEWRIRMEL